MSSEIKVLEYVCTTYGSKISRKKNVINKKQRYFLKN